MMDIKRDPEHIVALLRNVDVPNEEPRDVGPVLNDPIHDRFRDVLDAIACVLISSPTREVIAVGLQLPQSNTAHNNQGEIRLILAGSQDIPTQTLRHAEELVDDLRKLGEDFARWRRDTTPKMEEHLDQAQPADLAGVKSPVYDETKFPHLATQLYSFRSKVFAFSFPKILQRLHKKYHGISRGQAFVDFASRLRESRPEEYDQFGQISDIIGWMMRNFPEGSTEVPRSKAEMLAAGLTYIYDRVRDLQATPRWEDTFARFFHSHDKTAAGFPLGRFLEKMVSSSDATQKLLKFVYSPRLYRKYLAGTAVHFCPLRNSPRPIHLPHSDEWGPLSRQVLMENLDKSEYDEIKDKDTPVPKLEEDYKEKKSVQAPVHCECLLALHHIEEQKKGIPSIPYIGVSKLSCLACWKFLTSLRHAGRLVYTKGTHGKAYFPWKYPDTEINQAIPDLKAQVLQSFCEQAATTYARRLHRQVQMRRLSDSSAGSASSEDVISLPPGFRLDEFKAKT